MASRNREISNWIPRRKTGNATGTVPTRGSTVLSCTSPARPAAGNGSPAMPGMNAFLWLSFPPLRWRGQEHPLPAAPRYATAATPDCWHPWLRSFWKHSSNQRQPTGSGTNTAAMRNAPNTQERNRPFLKTWRKRWAITPTKPPCATWPCGRPCVPSRTVRKPCFSVRRASSFPFFRPPAHRKP